ncbi:hypothetical protein ACH5RR_011259 [Cinchona calisaya]|uniref:Uncharacterized protein n=1 Tax=Cinchona calisaya TaxID=153742 RepID=A0ABD3A4X9_9GENT
MWSCIPLREHYPLNSTPLLSKWIGSLTPTTVCSAIRIPLRGGQQDVHLYCIAARAYTPFLEEGALTYKQGYCQNRGILLVTILLTEGSKEMDENGRYSGRPLRSFLHQYGEY